MPARVPPRGRVPALPRCADRPPVETVAAPPRFEHTRWHRTDTTLGPRAKVGITALLVYLILHLAYVLSKAGDQPVYTFAIVPLTGLVIFAIRFLPELWERGGLRPGVRRTEDR